MSKLRPTLNTRSTLPCMSNGTAYAMILTAVQTRRGLLHGKLHHAGEHCAIGSYFHINRNTSLPETLIDEVAAFNDSMPQLTDRQRKRRVESWLRWKLRQMGYPLPGRKGKAP